MKQLELQLSEQETEQFAHCESIIEHGLETFYEVGKALLEIRDGRLYRETHKTFEEYCRSRWQMSRIHAHRMIEAAGITDNLLPIGNVKPASESQVRPLASLDPEDQRIVWNQAVAESDGQQPTASVVASIKQSLTKLIDERRNALERKAEPREPDPLTPKELRELRERMRVNSEYNGRLMAFVGAIEILSHPKLPIGEVAEQIRDMDTPDKDWCGQAQLASEVLNELAEELQA